MMLRLIQAGLGRPLSGGVDPNAYFQPGMLAQMKTIGNDVLVGVSDGLSVFGIFDDVKEQPGERKKNHCTQIITVEKSGKFELTHPFIDEASWVVYSRPFDGHISLASAENGVIEVSKPGTYEVWYDYSVPGSRAEDTTAVSGKATVWFTPGIYATDQYDYGCTYAAGDVLYSNKDGKLTTKRDLHPNLQPVGQVMEPPSVKDQKLQFYFNGPTSHPGPLPAVAKAEAIPDYKPEVEVKIEGQVAKISAKIPVLQPISSLDAEINGHEAEAPYGGMTHEEAMAALKELEEEMATEAVAVGKSNQQTAEEIASLKEENAALTKKIHDLEITTAGNSIRAGFYQLQSERKEKELEEIKTSQETGLASFIVPALAAVAVGAILGPSAAVKKSVEVGAKA